MSLKETKNIKIRKKDEEKLDRLVRSTKKLVEWEIGEEYPAGKMDPVMKDFEQQVREIYQRQELERQKKEAEKKLKKAQKKRRW